MRTILALLIACSSIAVASSAAAQQVAVGTGKPAPASSAFRKLAPGVETTIRAADRPVELISRHDLAEILAANPNYGVREGDPAPSPALKVRFGHDVRGLDFTFKPLRMILVDVPNSLGKMDQKLVWYLVYHVNNTDADKPFLFAPKFTLTDLDRNVSYADQLIPVAEPAIRRREDPNRKLLNTYTIAGEIPPNGESWAVVTWTDLPSTLRRISITIEGLSMAYRWDEEAQAAAADPNAPLGAGRKLLPQVLKINFWRPGDEFYEHEREIRYGIPGDVDYRWLYQ